MILRGKVTETFMLILVFKETCGLELFAAHVSDVIESNLLSVNWKLTCKIFLHKFVWLQEFCKTELELVDKDINEFVSYNDKFTSGFESIETQAIWYVVAFFVRLIVWFEFTIWLLKIMLIVGKTFF